ncbi:MAG: phosphoribosylaminoimidazole carboxylase [Proteobacteria bacterium]|nr:phosphoribosylaminoimidazole carboxylase [Pseudomonadota bacterium]
MHLPGNLFRNIPADLPEELFQTLARGRDVRIERIVSRGHSSPEGFWYDQDENEWVILLAGSAGIRFEVEEEAIPLFPGDWLDIPARARHRLEWTDESKETVWLAVYYQKP